MSQVVVYNVVVLIYYLLMLYIFVDKQLFHFKMEVEHICLMILNVIFLYIMSQQYYVTVERFLHDLFGV